MKLIKIASLLLLQLSFSYASPSFVSNGLVAHYPFNGDTNDTVGGYHGVKHGSTALGSNFLSFNGTDDYIDLSSANGLIVNKSSFTLSYWVNTPSTKVYSFLSKRNHCHMGDAFDMRGKNTINFENLKVNNHGGLHLSLYDCGWQLVTIVKDQDNYSLYHNATLNDSKTFNNSKFTQGNLSFSNSPCINVDGTNRFEGNMDDLRIYNRALNLDEIGILYIRTDPRLQATIPSNTSTTSASLHHVKQ